MTEVFRLITGATVLAGGLALSACAVAPQEPTGGASAAAAARSDKAVVGTRLPVATTDRMVKQIGNAGAREMARDKPPNPGSPVN